MKIMKLLAACAMVGALATTSAMAAKVENSFLGEYDATNNSITINLDNGEIKTYATKVSGDFTVLVTNVETGTISNTQIFQIDQAADLDNDGNDNTSTCVLKLSAAVAADYTAVTTKAKDAPSSSTYYVRLGGAEGEYIYDTFTFTAPVDNNKVEVTVDNTTANAFGTTGSSAVIVTATSKIPAGKAVAYDGTPMYYTEYTVDGKNVVKYVALCADFDSTKIALVDGANTRIAYGNLADTDVIKINIGDINEMINIVLSPSLASTDKIKLIADVNADGKINIGDINETINMVLSPSYNPPASYK